MLDRFEPNRYGYQPELHEKVNLLNSFYAIENKLNNLARIEKEKGYLEAKQFAQEQGQPTVEGMRDALVDSFAETQEKIEEMGLESETYGDWPPHQYGFSIKDPEQFRHTLELFAKPTADGMEEFKRSEVWRSLLDGFRDQIANHYDLDSADPRLIEVIVAKDAILANAQKAEAELSIENVGAPEARRLQRSVARFAYMMSAVSNQWLKEYCIAYRAGLLRYDTYFDLVDTEDERWSEVTQNYAKEWQKFIDAIRAMRALKNPAGHEHVESFRMNLLKKAEMSRQHIENTFSKEAKEFYLPIIKRSEDALNAI